MRSISTPRWKTSSAPAASGSRSATSASTSRAIWRDFLFSPARAHSPVRSLVGGERNRLLLARLFARPANVLVLDEPTNDLDIDTLELLEDLLQNYDGTVFLVSHDRTFLDNVVTSTIAFEGDGHWREYEGGVQDWLTQSRRARDIAVQRAAVSPSPAATVSPATPRHPVPMRPNVPQRPPRSSATRSKESWRHCPRRSLRWKKSRSSSQRRSSWTVEPSMPSMPHVQPRWGSAMHASRTNS